MNVSKLENLADITLKSIAAIINLTASSTKTGRRRFIQMPPPLKACLKAYPLKETVLPSNWHKK